MAKRRNAKKEKAARNKINARQFRKKFSYSSRNRRFGGSGRQNSNQEEDNNSSESDRKNSD